MFENKTRLDKLRIDRLHSVHHKVPSIHALYVCWIDIEVDFVDVPHPVGLERTLEDSDCLSLAAH